MHCSVTGQISFDMKKIVAVTSYRSVGCTFLDWSLLFLSGQTHHYVSKLQKNVLVPDDPLTEINAHGHLKNHPNGSATTRDTINDLLTNGADVQTLYPTTMRWTKALELFNIGIEIAQTSEDVRKQISQFIADDYRIMVENLNDLEIPLIFVESDTTVIGYHWTTRALGLQFSNKKTISYQDVFKEHQEFFFRQSHSEWSKRGLTEVWDQREQLALNIRPFSTENFPKIGLKTPYLHVNCQTLWNLAPDVLQQCFDYLNIPMQQSRWNHWLSVAKKWQQIQHETLKFPQCLPHIVDAIVHGWYFPLPRLELMQEAIIQHCLIYQHDLNLKTWQLTHFPDNTQKLHQLLEPNIHKVSRLYGDVPVRHIY